MMNQTQRERMIQLAKANIVDGVLEEPRLYFDEIFLPQNLSFPLPEFAQLAKGDAEVFINREKFPVRLTHMTLSTLDTSHWVYANNVSGADTVYQGFENNPSFDRIMGLYLEHTNYYFMRRQFIPFAAWSNQTTNTHQADNGQSATWEFARPALMGPRDALRVTVRLDPTFWSWPFLATIPEQVDNPGVPRLLDVLRLEASVVFSGVGLLTKQPYYYGGKAVFEKDAAPLVVLDPGQFRNGGMEPIVLLSMAVVSHGLVCQMGAISIGSSSAEVAVPVPVETFSVGVRLEGNGTQEDWIVGPQNNVTPEECPAHLVGMTSGPSVIHRFPGDGVILQPGEGFRASVCPAPAAVSTEEAADSSTAEDGPVEVDARVARIALAGYLVVT